MEFGGILSYHDLTVLHSRSCDTFFNRSKCTSSASLCNKKHFSPAIISRFTPEKVHIREALLFCFNLETSAAKSHQLLVEAYGDSGLTEKTYRDWFQQLKDGSFDLSDKKRENRSGKVKDLDFQALLDEDDTQSQTRLAGQLGASQAAIFIRLRAMEKVKKVNNECFMS